VASGWAIAIKVSLGKLRIDGALDRFLPEQLAANGFRPLAIDLKHAVSRRIWRW
jgi:PIN domain nuclease of toxin-antitoxin system